MLTTGKLNALKYCIICSLDMMTRIFSERIFQKEMLDHKLKRCPDMRCMLQLFKVNWNKVEGYINWLMKIVPNTILQFYKCGAILEPFYDAN